MYIFIVYQQYLLDGQLILVYLLVCFIIYKISKSTFLCINIAYLWYLRFSKNFRNYLDFLIKWADFGRSGYSTFFPGAQITLTTKGLYWGIATSDKPFTNLWWNIIRNNPSWVVHNTSYSDTTLRIQLTWPIWSPFMSWLPMNVIHTPRSDATSFLRPRQCAVRLYLE